MSETYCSSVAVEQGSLGHRLQIELGVAPIRAQQQLLGLQRDLHLLLEDLLVEQVLHADADGEPCRRSGADAATGRADRSLPSIALPAGVEHDVVRHDQVRVGADAQAADVDTAGRQPVELTGQHQRVDDDAVADDAQLALVQHPRGDQVELVRDAFPDDRVPGVVAALEAHDHLGAFGEQVDDLPLAFIAPLGADEHDSGHSRGKSRPYRPGSPAGSYGSACETLISPGASKRWRRRSSP